MFKDFLTTLKTDSIWDVFLKYRLKRSSEDLRPRWSIIFIPLTILVVCVAVGLIVADVFALVEDIPRKALSITGLFLYFALMTYAFSAASMGAHIRGVIDRSPLLHQFLTVPDSEKGLDGALIRALWNFSRYAFFFSFFAYLILFLALVSDQTRLSAIFSDNILVMIVSILRPEQTIGFLHPVIFPLGLTAITIAAFNYASGVFLRGSILSSYPQYGGANRITGGTMTFFLILATVFSYIARLIIIDAFAGTFGFFIYPELLAFILVEVMVLGFRIVLSCSIWQRNSVKINRECREYVESCG